RSVLRHHDHILNVPMTAVRLDRQHHAFLEHDVTGAGHNRLLLVPPAAHAVTDQHRLVFPTLLLEFFHNVHEYVRRADTRLAALDGPIVDVADDLVLALLLSTRLAENRIARLMTGVTRGAIGDVIVTDDIAALEHGIAFAAVICRIGAGRQNSVRPAGAARQAIVHNPAM